MLRARGVNGNPRHETFIPCLYLRQPLCAKSNVKARRGS